MKKITVKNLYKETDKYANSDPRVIVIHKNNGGVSSARNAALDVAKGDYIVFVDSDDYVDKDAYLTMYNEAVRVNADYVCCGYKRIAHGKCVWAQIKYSVSIFSNHSFVLFFSFYWLK